MDISKCAPYWNRRDVEDRLAAQTVRGSPDECWPFTGYMNRKGYGRIRFQGRKALAHRVAYILAKGPIPEGMLILHSCDNPSCCNPAHLSSGTNQQNITEAWERGLMSPRKGTEINTCKLSPDDIHRIRASSESDRELAARYGVTYQNINSIRAGKSWKHLPKRIVRIGVNHGI